jgi:ribosome-associated heat shock protein Hsp15
MTGERQGQSVRLDKWLWAARFFKTRSLAARAITGGKVQLNGRRAKRASTLHIGDQLRVRKGPAEFHLRVTALSEQRRSAAEAAKLYEEDPESIAARLDLKARRRATPTFSFREKGRPSKKERRQLNRLKRGKPEP